MEVVHISAECFPAAKAGGLGDVVGALPKYQNSQGITAPVFLPKYSMAWFEDKEYKTVYSSKFWLPNAEIHFTIQLVKNVDLGFPLYVVDIPGKFNRNGIYKDKFGYFGDMSIRWMSFQRAVIDWLFFGRNQKHPDIIHCHDYHTGLIPFMLKFCYGYMGKHNIKTVFTIHNEKYHGDFGWNEQYLIPHFDTWKSGFLDWNNRIDPLASAIRTCDILTTVSPSYAEELKYDSGGLEWLFQNEDHKTTGIINGIDTEVWSPKTDPLIHFQLKKSVKIYKQKNKVELCEYFNLDSNLPLMSFIGRMVYEKGTDELARAIEWLSYDNASVNFIILGTGSTHYENQFKYLKNRFPDTLGVNISYNEKLAHQIYAGSDFLLMPSRIEPCGLNQMYAIRYATLPIVNRVGGLKDTVVDISLSHATGITFEPLQATKIQESIYRGLDLYKDQKLFNQIRQQCLEKDFSWEHSTSKYIKAYESLISSI